MSNGTFEDAIRVTQGMPDVEVEVVADVTISHEGVAYTGGETLTLSGPLAENFAAMGAVIILG